MSVCVYIKCACFLVILCQHVYVHTRMHSRYPPAPADAAESVSDSGSRDPCQRGVLQTCGAPSRADRRQ